MKKRIHVPVCTKLFTYAQQFNKKNLEISGRILNLVEEPHAQSGAAN
jgi:hypothetical protein